MVLVFCSPTHYSFNSFQQLKISLSKCCNRYYSKQHNLTIICIQHPICIILPHTHYSKDQNRLHISPWLYSFQAVCDRCFMGRSAVVVDVLSMIQCSTSDGRERQRERCLCLDVQGGTFNI